ncbi:MAG: carbohydrate ABC transporter permease [Caldilinea sp.]|nr:carbohydrate ABC transporter permease [Caldilinea sp.]MCB9113806.1 carbohydrate ABC transporter permease [Caldilineaceae bacterium]MCB0040626.1 carbohydrate ABC transporter permease [Caldilinea sp.]MCB9123079.1 carbohydrate ABC transporter permease [Caldilineaceae bacterium]MCO5210979.1 carbohydrate ABC transporter permease [Caldilinea sp.]
MTTLSASPTRMSTPARVGLHALLLFFSTIMLAPFAVMFVVSLLPNTAFLARDFSPANFSLNNYIRTFEAVPFGRYYLNSVVVSVSVTTVQILISSLAAFAFARLRFRGREAIFLFYLATLMIPFPVTLIPNFLIIKNFGWYDTYLALIVPGLFSVFSTFLLRQYYRGIPLDFDEAARMDGASSLRIWWQIIVPLSGPVLATLAIFVFQGVWNDFLWPLVVTTSENMRTIPVGLAAFVGQYSTAWDLLMAGSVIALLPVLVIYVLGQKWFVQGIALSGMGGR